MLNIELRTVTQFVIQYSKQEEVSKVEIYLTTANGA